MKEKLSTYQIVHIVLLQLGLCVSYGVTLFRIVGKLGDTLGACLCLYVLLQ